MKSEIMDPAYSVSGEGLLPCSWCPHMEGEAGLSPRPPLSGVNSTHKGSALMSYSSKRPQVLISSYLGLRIQCMNLESIKISSLQQ